MWFDIFCRANSSQAGVVFVSPPFCGTYLYWRQLWTEAAVYAAWTLDSHAVMSWRKCGSRPIQYASCMPVSFRGNFHIWISCLLVASALWGLPWAACCSDGHVSHWSSSPWTNLVFSMSWASQGDEHHCNCAQGLCDLGAGGWLGAEEKPVNIYMCVCKYRIWIHWVHELHERSGPVSSPQV